MLQGYVGVFLDNVFVSSLDTSNQTDSYPHPMVASELDLPKITLATYADVNHVGTYSRNHMLYIYAYVVFLSTRFGVHVILHLHSLSKF